jgi:hypothetical protein
MLLLLPPLGAADWWHCGPCSWHVLCQGCTNCKWLLHQLLLVLLGVDLVCLTST